MAAWLKLAISTLVGGLTVLMSFALLAAVRPVEVEANIVAETGATVSEYRVMSSVTAPPARHLRGESMRTEVRAKAAETSTPRPRDSNRGIYVPQF